MDHRFFLNLNKVYLCINVCDILLGNNIQAQTHTLPTVSSKSHPLKAKGNLSHKIFLE